MNDNPQKMPPVPPFVRFVASAVPMVFDNSLSYYEALCALWKYIQSMTDVINNNATLEEEYIEKFNELKAYVDNYFDNLDVQEEINNKLDAMAESGELADIIAQFLNSTAIFGFDTVADMKVATNLINGSYARTLGFHSIDDGGGALYHITDTGTANEMDVIAVGDLYANLVEAKNVRQYGAYGDGTHDDTAAIQLALNSNDITYVPSGEYYITSKLTMRHNTQLIGTSRKDTIFKVDSTLASDYILQYGSSFNYGQEAGIIKNICFSSDENTRNSYGILLNSGLSIDECYFRYLKQAISKPDQYVDLIKITRSTIAYCSNTSSRYVVDLGTGNGEGIEIDELKVITSYDEDTFNEYMGIKIRQCYGGSINNSILNCPLIIDRCKAFSVNNCHLEGDADNASNNLSYIKITNSEVSLNNNYMHKRSNGSNLIIGDNQTSPPTQLSTNVIINNFTILYTDVFLDLVQNTASIYDIEKGTNSTLKIHNCFVMFDMSRWTTTGEVFGVRIKDLPKFNEHSSTYSYDCFIGLNNNILTDVNKIKANASYTQDNFLRNTSANINIPWYESGFNNTTVYYQAIYVLDEGRKLALFKTSNGNGNSATGVTSGTIATAGKKGVLIRNDRSLITDGLGAYLYIYRGTDPAQYNKLTKVASCSANYLHDCGTYIDGFPTADRTLGGIDSFTYVSDYKTDGENVSFVASSYPSSGTFVKGDRCINSTITAGGVKSWVYNGAAWISEGNYPS